jgi:integrase
MSQGVKALTAAAVEKYKPTAKLREIKDGATMGLYLTIHPSGTKVWCMKLTRPDGRSGHLTLGRVDLSGSELQGEPVIGQPLSLAAARLLAAKVHRDRQMGKDVIAENKSAKRRKKLQVLDDQANTFGAAARLFIERYAMKHQRRWQDTAYTLGLDYSSPDEPVVRQGGLAQRWATKPVREIDDSDIFEVVREAGHSGVPGSKMKTKGHSDARERAVFAALSGVFRYLKQERKIAANPCIGAVTVAPFKVRDRVLDNYEIRWFWAACEKEGWPFGPVFKLLLLTGQRLNEIAGMRRAELTDDALNLPPARTKNKKPHVVPLVEAAKALIPAEGDWVFSTTGQSAISGWSTAKARLDAAMLAIARKEKGKDFIIPDWVLHDLRRTAATHMGELGIAPHVIEAVLNHISGSKAGIAGTYNRSHMLPERRAALERWASHVLALVAGNTANVIPLKRKAQV